jgi:hypothetical protein
MEGHGAFTIACPTPSALPAREGKGATSDRGMGIGFTRACRACRGSLNVLCTPVARRSLAHAER